MAKIVGAVATRKLFIAGAQKSGTSSLHQALRHHSQIEPARRDGEIIKELQYFKGRMEWKERPLSWYEDHWTHTSLYEIDGTPNYLSFPPVQEKIRELYPDARFIITLRNPVFRAISAYNHYLQRMAVTAVNNWDWRAPGDTLEANLKGEIDNPFPIYRGLLGRGRYFDQIDLLLQEYPRKQILVLILEEWMEEPGQAAIEIQKFLGLKLEYLEITHKHKRFYENRIQTADVRTLLGYYQEHNQRFFKWFGRSIPQWQEQATLMTGIKFNRNPRMKQ